VYPALGAGEPLLRRLCKEGILISRYSLEIHANSGVCSFDRLSAGRENGKVLPVGTRSSVGGRGVSAHVVRPPEGEFVSGELAADCARFLAETRRRVEQRRTVESRPLVRADSRRV
jgi:hypothetical protein